MVAIRPKTAESTPKWRKWIYFASLLLGATTLLYLLFPSEYLRASLRRQSANKPQVAFFDGSTTASTQQQQHQAPSDRKCPYMSLNDLTNDERYPKQGTRHMVTPPVGGDVTLVCCSTTAGPWNILVHKKWAPLGAQRFLDMVTSNYFDASPGVPLMRCVKGFLCQFGLAGDTMKTHQYDQSLLDDKPWLPQGPDHRENKAGVKRFAKGYLAYAGAGPKTRSNQFIVSLKATGPLAGGAPWEVPWGELVGLHSFETLDKIYTGYGEHGPPQGVLRKEGASENVQTKWPLLDYVTSCEVVDHEAQKEQ